VDFEFTVMAVGRGDDVAEAWDDARESLERKLADGNYDKAVDITAQPPGRVHRVPIESGLAKSLYKQSLSEYLTDDAEQALGVVEVEGEMRITVDGSDFVVTFIPTEGPASA